MSAEQFIKAALAARAHRDGAPHGGINNMLAVAFVNRNRQRAGWCGGSWMEIIGRGDEYAGTLYPPSMPDLRDLQFRSLLSQIDDIYSGLAIDRMTEGALYYCELNRLDRPWFRDEIVRNPKDHPRIANVGNVVFFA